MKFSHTKHKLTRFQLSVTLLSLFLIGGCSDGNNSSSDRASGNGALSFTVAYHGTDSERPSKMAKIDCVGQDVAKVEAKVYGPGKDLLAEGGPWNCDAGQGTISSVPIGSGRTVGVWAKDAQGDIVFSGRKSDIDVVADRENSAGTIECFAFVPDLQAPQNGSVIEAGTMVLEWTEVSGAAQYRVVVSHNSDLSDPIIDEATGTTNFTRTGVSYSEPCYWQVYAIGPDDNPGMGSEIWSFRSPNNVSPFAQITCPANGLIYVQGDTIRFTGSGTDINDGDLSGEALVWSSDLDGQIGIGQTCPSALLDAGTHQISLTATDSDGLSWTDTVTITVNAGDPVGPLPDTGQIISHTDTLGEDADYTINPPSYTKLDAAGNDLDPCATEWAMVKDNVTGLVWEVKTDDGGIHDKDDTYVLERVQDGDLHAQSDFIERLNRENFGDKSDWRLPTIRELTLIVNRNNRKPSINTAYFPNTNPALYWSFTTHSANSDRLWAVHFWSGYSFAHNESHNKTNSHHVRAVRGEQFPANLVDNGDNTVNDEATRLMWQKLEVVDDNGEVRAMTWEEALSYCENLELAEYDDWRLPNVNELQSIVDYETYFPAVDTTIFGHIADSIYWSSTSYANDQKIAWGARFSFDGYIYQLDKSNTHQDEGLKVMSVRAVRNY